MEASLDVWFTKHKTTTFVPVCNVSPQPSLLCEMVDNVICHVIALNYTLSLCLDMYHHTAITMPATIATTTTTQATTMPTIQPGEHPDLDPDCSSSFKFTPVESVPCLLVGDSVSVIDDSVVGDSVSVIDDSVVGDSVVGDSNDIVVGSVYSEK